MEQVTVMVSVDAAVLADPIRLAAADRAGRVLPALPMPLEAIARLAARLTGAPMGLLTLVGDDRERVAGAFGMPASLVTGGRLDQAYSVCKFVVSADGPVGCADMPADPGPAVREHRLAREYGVRAFLGVPIRDAEHRPVGALTVLDTRPRRWTGVSRVTLCEVASLVDHIPSGTPREGTRLLAALDSHEVLDAIAEAFLTLDAEGVVTGWNTAAQDLIGFTAQQACGRRVEELLRAEYDGRPVRAVIGQLLTGPGDARISGTVVLRHRDGRRLHAQVRLSVLHGAGGAVVCVFFTDITAQVVAAEAASDAAAKAGTDAATQRGFADALLDSLDEGVVAVDAAGRPVVFNRALRRLHGLPDALAPEDARTAAMPHLHRLDGSPMPAEELTLARALRGQTVRDVETLVREPDRPDRFLLASAQPVRTGGERLIGAVCTVREVTDRRRAERFRDCQLAVARTLARPGDLHELAAEVLSLVAEAVGWPYLSLRLVEDATDSLARIASWHAEGYDLADLLPDRLPRTAPDLPAAVWATGRPVWEPDLAAAQRMTDPDSQTRARAYARRGLHGALGVPVLDGDQVRGVLTSFAATAEHDEFLLTGLLTDVATQIGQCLGRRHADELKAQLVRARADFTALIGHDMRTPLTTIATYAQLLLEDPEPRPDTDRQLLDGIDRNATTLRALVDGLLDVAALEADDEPLVAQTVDLTALLTEACDAARPAAAGNSGLEVRLGERIHVTGDPARLRQLAERLLTAALTANAGSGQLDAQLDQDRGGARFTVAGPAAMGDPAESFRRFSPANTTGTGDAETSTRIDLLLCRLIAERHAGSLALGSRPDGGSTLTLRLPLAPGSILRHGGSDETKARPAELG